MTENKLNVKEKKLILNIKGLLKTHFNHNEIKEISFQQTKNKIELNKKIQEIKNNKKFIKIYIYLNIYKLRMKINKIRYELIEFMEQKKICKKEKNTILQTFSNFQDEITTNLFKDHTNNQKLNIFKGIKKQTINKYSSRQPNSVTCVNNL